MTILGNRENVYCFCGRVPWLYQYWPGGFMLFVVLCPGTPEGSTGSGSGFKASQKTGQRLKVSSDRLGEAGNRTCDPWFTRHRFIPYTTAASQGKMYIQWRIQRGFKCSLVPVFKISYENEIICLSETKLYLFHLINKISKANPHTFIHMNPLSRNPRPALDIGTIYIKVQQ